jgi:Lipid A 3-O-deacylase (PagL)
LFEAHVGWKTRKTFGWSAYYGYPSYGVSIIHAQFGNQSILGQSIGAIPTLSWDRRTTYGKWSLRAGLGMAWFNKPYDLFENPANLVIGSTWANLTMIRAEWSTALTARLRWHAGISFTHSSNAHVRVPNIGANVVAFTTGLSFTREEVLLDIRSKPHLRNPRHWAYGMYGIYGLHEAYGTIRPTNGLLFPIYGASLYAERHGFRGKSYSFGINYHYYPFFKSYALSQELFEDDANVARKSQTVVMYAGYEWRFHRMAVFAQVGANLYNPFVRAMNEVWDLPKHGWLYVHTSNKLGYRYYITSPTKRWQYFVQAAVKANGGTADFFEMGIGVTRLSVVPEKMW